MPRLPLAIVLAASTVTCSLFLAGCEGDEASRSDQKVNRELAKAYTSENPMDDLKKAADNDRASGASRARALAALAAAEVRSADEQGRQVDENEAKIATLVWEIGQLGQQLQTSQRLIDAYRSYDPAVVRQAAEARVKEAQGENIALQLRGEQVNLPAEAAVKQNIQRLQGDIQQQEGELKQITQHRDELVQQADQAARQSEEAKGHEAVETFTKASNLRKEASLLSSRIDAANSKLASLKAELEGQQGQQQILAGLVKQYEEGAQTTEKGFEAVAAQEEAQRRLIQEIYGGSGNGRATSSPSAAPATIQSRAAQLASLVNDTEQLRNQAIEKLNSAIQHYTQAQQAAEDYQRKLGEKIGSAPADAPQRVAWEDMRKLVNPSAYQLQKAVALQALGSVQASQLESLRARVQLANTLGKTLQAAGLKMPESLSAKDAAGQLKQAAEAVNKTYADASDLETTVLQGPMATEDQKNAARVQRILTLWGWSNAASIAGNAADAKKYHAEALEMVKGAIADNVTLPALPADIAPAPKVATTAPAAAPGGTPPMIAHPAAPAPAGGAAPAQPAAPATK